MPQPSQPEWDNATLRSFNDGPHIHQDRRQLRVKTIGHDQRHAPDPFLEGGLMPSHPFGAHSRVCSVESISSIVEEKICSEASSPQFEELRERPFDRKVLPRPSARSRRKNCQALLVLGFLNGIQSRGRQQLLSTLGLIVSGHLHF